MLAALIVTCAASASAQQPDGPIQARGSIDTSFDDTGLEGISVAINGEAAELDGDGRYSASLPVAPYYRVTIHGQSIFTSIQTFGIAELYSAQCSCLELPSIGVVARKEGRTELLFAGDAMAGRRYSDPIWGERVLVDRSDPLPDLLELLEPMRPYIESADLASVNLEIVLSQDDPEQAAPKSVIFYAPPELAEALAQVGFNHVSLGNNHSYDYLQEGLDTTIEAVEAAGLEWSGAGANEEEALRASRLNVGGQNLSLLGYVGWRGRVEPNQIAESDKGGAAYGSDANIEASVAREATLGREVIVQYHGSREYSDNPTEVSERRMRLAVDNGAVLVASHHPHVAHGVELYGGALIAYSTGNFLFDQYFLETHGSFVLKAWMEEGRVIRAELIPIRVLDYRPVPAVGSMREAVLERIVRLSAQRGTVVSRNGGHGLILPAMSEAAGAVESPAGGNTTRELLRGGDFENAVFGTAIDRSLKVYGADWEHVFDGPRGHALQLVADGEAGQVSITPSTFFRVAPGNRVTISGRIRAAQSLTVSVANQERPAGVGRFEALETAPVFMRASQPVEESEGWAEFELSFDLSEGETPRPFRPILYLSAQNGGALAGSPIALDDLKVVVATR